MHIPHNSMISLVIGLVEERMVRSGLEVRAIDESTNLIEEGIVDSLEFLELIASLEERAGVELDFLDLDPEIFTTVGGLAMELTRAADKPHASVAI